MASYNLLSFLILNMGSKYNPISREGTTKIQTNCIPSYKNVPLNTWEQSLNCFKFFINLQLDIFWHKFLSIMFIIIHEHKGVERTALWSSGNIITDFFKSKLILDRFHIRLLLRNAILIFRNSKTSEKKRISDNKKTK